MHARIDLEQIAAACASCVCSVMQMLIAVLQPLATIGKACNRLAEPNVSPMGQHGLGLITFLAMVARA